MRNEFAGADHNGLLWVGSSPIGLIERIFCDMPPASCRATIAAIGCDCWRGFGYGHLIAYGISIGLLTAFVQPARDGMPSEIAGTAAKSRHVGDGPAGGQLIGFTREAPVSVVSVSLLQLQAVIIASGLSLYTRFPSHRAKGKAPSASSARHRVLDWPSVGQGITCDAPGDPRISNELAYGGAYAVLVLLMARDVFSGGAQELAQCFIAFVLGTVTMTLILSQDLKLNGL